MGNSGSDLSEAEFRQQWKITEKNNELTIWQNKKNSHYRLEEYNVRDDQLEKNLQLQKKLAHLRRTSPFVVNAYTLKKDGFSCQMDHDSKKVYVQRTTLRLSNLKDIPYPDIFHLYDVSLNGYKLLTEAVGYFSVDEDQIGINQAGQAKVWLSTQFQSNKVIGGKVTQSKMVSDILEMLHQVADNDSVGKYPNIYWYIGSHENITFVEARQKFEQYMRAYCEGWVPTHLHCVVEVGSNEIEGWCRSNQSHGFTPDNARKSVQLGQTAFIVSNGAQITNYANNSLIQSTPVNNVTTTNAPVNNQSNGQTVSVYLPNNTPTTESKVAQPYPSSPAIADVTQPPAAQIISSVVRPLNSETLANGASPPKSSGLNNRPTSSLNLARTNSQNIAAENLTQFIQRPVILSSQFNYTNNNGVPPQPFQPQPQNNQRFFQPQPQIPPKGLIEQPNQPLASFSQPQPVVLGNTTAVSQSPNPSYNQPLQFFESFSVPREDNRLQQQRVISQTIELKDGGKVTETETNRIPPPTNNLNNGLKASQKANWDTSNQKSATKGLNTFGRPVPYSFDVAADQKTSTPIANNKFTAENDGKSSPQFLALLSQIKSGMGGTSSISDNYSYSPSKLQGPGSYGSAFQESKFTTSNYVSSKYQGGIDPEIHADLQKYK